jgi:hypothetical protein
MDRKTLYATLAFSLAAAPALAGEAMLSGLGSLGYRYTDYDVTGAANTTSNTIQLQGSALWTWPSMWNAQGDFTFASESFDLPLDPTIDTWSLGGIGFIRDPAQGLIGAELAYQSLDAAASADGIRLGGRAELFLPDITLGMRLGHQWFDAFTPFNDFSGWYIGADGTLYHSMDWAFRGGIRYHELDNDAGDLEEWNLGGEVEYLFPGCATSLYAGLAWTNSEVDGVYSYDAWSLGLGLRLHLANQGQLIDLDRSGPVRPTGIQLGPLF